MSFDIKRGYAGGSPGQMLDAVLDRLTIRDLQIVVGTRVLPLLPIGTQSDRTALKRAALRMIRNRPRLVFSSPDLRKTLLRNLDPGKIDELEHRVAKEGLVVERDLSDHLTSSAVWPIVSGFFGLEPEELANAARELPRQSIGTQFGLFAHQRSVVRRTYGKIGSGYGRTLIHMPTGAGKTRTAMHYIARILNESEPCVVAWLASSRELLEQAAETFETAWAALGNRPLVLHRFWGDYNDAPGDLTDGVVVGGLAKLHAWRSRDSTGFLRLSARTRLIVMDEAHQAIAPTYRAVIEGLADAGQADAVLGLSATPGRSWNDIAEDKELARFFGGSKVVLEVDGYDNPVEYLLTEGYLARPEFSRIEYQPETSPSPEALKRLARLDDYSDDILEKLAMDTGRNLAVIEGVRQLINRGHQRIILFAASVGHAEDLAAALSAYEIESLVVTGGTPAARRSAILKTFKSPAARPIVVCNFGVLTTGFDAPRTSAAIIARPTKSLVLFSQMVGRATRGIKAGGNATCEILTVHDPNYPGFGDVAEAFFNWEDVWNEH
ncbi:DEAD/DEAH box helicase [Paenirhodobacter populi]|uniref:DEAD/DEAH box helicase n=1 Tax=Paenirhodobacter populi TaxID=2306993 RepID=A0A443JR91_9RHOB|nr:DEAD/DEAH box helicase [Sinirhodobacter populi]RWR23031.1 DEAD/DEAH box helicase [Sinirhodobacter populi]